MSNETKAAVKAAPINRNKTGTNSKVRFITVTAMLSAVAFILMYFEIPISIMPPFIKFDFSDLPEVIGTFAYGPMCGVLICLIKNVLHLMFSNSMFVGEVSNFILGVAFVVPAGLIYKHKKSKKSALIGGIVGAVFMGIFCVPSNYYIVYPVYYKVAMSQAAILKEYRLIAPAMKNIMQCLLCFNLPFTIVKGLISVAITMLIYKPLSPILKGRYNN